jgi:hypothetical protein
MKNNFKSMFGAGLLGTILSLAAFPVFATTYSIVEAPTALPPSGPVFPRVNPPGMNNLGQIVGEKMLWSGGVDGSSSDFLL